MASLSVEAGQLYIKELSFLNSNLEPVNSVKVKRESLVEEGESIELRSL